MLMLQNKGVSLWIGVYEINTFYFWKIFEKTESGSKLLISFWQKYCFQFWNIRVDFQENSICIFSTN